MWTCLFIIPYEERIQTINDCLLLLLLLRIITSFISEPRKKQSEDFLLKIAPQLVIPFMIQPMILPLVLIGMKTLLLKSMFLGKIGIILWIIIIIRNMLNKGGGLYSHNVNIQHNEHPAHYQSGYT